MRSYRSTPATCRACVDGDMSPRLEKLAKTKLTGGLRSGPTLKANHEALVVASTRPSRQECHRRSLKMEFPLTVVQCARILQS